MVLSHQTGVRIPVALPTPQSPDVPDQFIRFEEGSAIFPLVERVWRCRSERGGTFASVAMSHWEMVISRHQGRTSLTVRGPETRASAAECPAEGEWLAIRFKSGTFMPRLPPGRLRDRNDVTLGDAGRRSFWLDGSAWEYPTFDTADVFVRRLVRRGVIATDGVVTDALVAAAENVHRRTRQRRFLQATGLTAALVRQIERARLAAVLLREGTPVLDVVDAAGYYDQAHLGHAFKRFVGHTPGEVARGGVQLSFLYKTTGA